MMSLIPVQGRLSLTSGVSVTESDVISATVSLVPDGIDSQPIFDGTTTQDRPFPEMTLALDTTAHPAVAGFDVFIAWQAGAMIIGTGPAWASAVLGASDPGIGPGTTEFERFEGRWVNKYPITLKNGSTVYPSIPARQATAVGGFMTNAAGLTADTKSERLLWSVNAANRITQGPDETGPLPDKYWYYSLPVYRQANNNPLNKFRVFQRLGGRMLKGEACSFITNSSSTKRPVAVGIGINSPTINAITSAGGGIGTVDTGGLFLSAKYRGYCPIGPTDYVWLENGGGGGDTQKWFGVQPKFAPGIAGEVFQ